MSVGVMSPWKTRLSMEFDYNPFASPGNALTYSTEESPLRLLLMKTRGKWIRLAVAAAALVAPLLVGWPWTGAAAPPLQEASPTARSSGPTITVTDPGPINVRSGPSSLDYPVIGNLEYGVTARAIGRSPAGEWIQVIAPENSNWAGTGWVYSALVSLTPGFLPVIEPPPTPSPQVTPTLNPTFIAAFRTVATSTRLPTFTQAPPLAIPTFSNGSLPTTGGLPVGWVIVVLGLLGAVGLAAAAIRRQ
jgi:hypothetical protein